MMNIKKKIYYIQQQADELSAEISKLMRKDADLSEKHLNDLIKLGVFYFNELSRVVG